MHVTLNTQLSTNMDHPNHEIKLARISVAFGPDPPNDPYVTSHCQPPPQTCFVTTSAKLFMDPEVYL